MNAQNGMTIVPSANDVTATTNKLEALISDKGMKVMARVNHTANAQSVGMELRPTELLIFGNPEAGTKLMLSSQSMGIDLPQKMLVWESEDGKVYIGFNDPAFLKARHSTEGCDKIFETITGALTNFAKAAAE